MWRYTIFCAMLTVAVSTTNIYTGGVDVQMTGTLAASGTVSDKCSDAFIAGFRDNVNDIAGRLSFSISQNMVPECPSDLRLQAGDLQFIVHGTQIRVVFGIRANSHQRDIEPSDACMTKISEYVQQTNSWRSPIITSVLGCPQINMAASQFYVKK